MLNILLAGVGGQGTVLAAKLLAQAAEEKGWQVRTAETIGMAQRGGNVVSHVRMGTADLVVAFEPAEAARVLPYLKPGGAMVCASTAIQPVSAALSNTPYLAGEVLGNLARIIGETGGTFVAVDDAALVESAGSRTALIVMLLACALSESGLPISVDDLKRAIPACVKERFVDMNLRAIDSAVRA